MSQQNRKRKLKVNNKSKPDKDECSPPKEKVHITEGMEEENLSSILFGDSKSFLKSLEEAVNEPETIVNTDSGIENGTSEEDTEMRPAWNDEDDEGIDVGAALKSQKRKLPKGGINSHSNKYSSLLKHKYEGIVGTPNWANLKKHKVSTGDSDEEILQTCGFIRKTEGVALPKGQLEYKKVKDLNCETYMEGPFINSIEFHPNSSVALVAGNGGFASLFAVDGRKNNKLHSVAFEKYPVYCSRFVRNGDEVILGSRRNFIYAYDLMATKTLRYKLHPGITQCKKFVVSPDMQYIAIAGKWGEVHLLSANTKDKLTTLQQDGEVTALEYNSKGNLLFGHSDTGRITIWDLNMRRVRHKFTDQGCLHGTTLSASSSNQFLASGSAEGVVNLYDMDSVLQNDAPKPRKSILNLTTSINNVKFNPSSETLCMTSSEIKNSIRLYHIGSEKVFSNFPSFESKLGHINCVNFSPRSGFLAIGNQKSVVSLFRLKHYKNY